MRCPWCHRDVPDRATVCPHADCGRPLGAEGRMSGLIPSPPPPPPIKPQNVSMPAPGPRPHEAPLATPPPPPGKPQMAAPPPTPAAPTIAAPPPPPGALKKQAPATPPPTAPPPAPMPVSAAAALPPMPPAPMQVPDELKFQLENLQQSVRRGRRRGALLRNGAIAAAILGAVLWAAHYKNSVLNFAELDPAIYLRRDPLDAQRLALVYRPTGTGTVAFRRADPQRETELLDRVLPGAVGKQQVFQWRVTGLQAGDLVNVTYRDGLRLATRELRVPEIVPRIRRPESPAVAAAAPDVPPGKGVLSGLVVNAINKEPVAGAAVRIKGTGLSAATDAAGRFRIVGTPAGLLPLEVSAEGFTAEAFEREVAAGREAALRVALSPGMDKGQMRIVLTWDDEPKDLDAHLEGPLPDGRRFHVYYHQPGDLRSREFVRLDVDDRQGGGPETITVLGVRPGVYRYFVHDYTNRNDPAGTALARSGAEVKLFHGGQTYRFRAGHDAAGNVWDVCTIEITPEGPVVRKVDQYEAVKVEALGLYDKRTLADRPTWIGRYGGSAISEEAVNDGLAWLARHQAPDGSWSNRCLGAGPESMCQQGRPCTGPGETYEMAHTGLALLAFQAGGHYYFNGAKYSDTVRKGLDWMAARQRPEGALVGTRPLGGYPKYHKNYMYEHGIAAFALTDAVAAARALSAPEEDRYVQAARKAVDFILRNQHNDGGWRYSDDPKEPGDTSVGGWQVLALKSAKEAGIEVPDAAVEKIRKFFYSREMGESGRTGYDDRTPQTDATTGVGMLARQFILNEPKAPLIAEAARYLADLAEIHWGDRRTNEGNRDYYLWYNCTLGMFQAGGENWEKWNRIVRDTIVNLQRHDGCERGSWDPNTRWGYYGGRIYTTALAILTLEVYYRYTPQTEIHAGQAELDATTLGLPDAAVEGELVEPELFELPSRGPVDRPKEPAIDQ